MKNSSTSLPEATGSKLLLARVYCALGIFPEPPMSEQIAGFFEKNSFAEIKSALDSLMARGLIEEKKGKLIYASRDLVYSDGDEIKSEARTEYVKESLEFARQMVPIWFKRRDDSYIEFCVVSVNASKFREALPRIREFFDLLQSELEVSQGADQLVHFNIQVFPES